MLATKRKDMRIDEFLLMKSTRKVWNVPRATVLLSTFLGLALLLACSFGCAPPSSTGDGQQNSSGSNDLPEITDELIRERINYTRVRRIPDEDGIGEPINWTFVENEPKEITVVDKRIEGNHATIVLDIKTGSGPNASNPRTLAGQIRTEWELKTGWALRKWEIVDTENISMKVRNLPKPPAQNSNR
jgi:hypothetical protein